MPKTRDRAATLPVRVTAKAQNAHLARIVDKYGTQKKAAAALGLSVGSFQKLLSFRGTPVPVTDTNFRYPEYVGLVRVGISRECADNLESECGLVLDEIFPDIPVEAMKQLSARRVYERQMSVLELEHIAESARLEYCPPADPLESAELKERINTVLRTLPEREKAIVEMRFGLTGRPAMTLREIAEELGVTQERARQLEARAIRWLQAPDRSAQIVEFVRD